jgi:hypothetical protein
VYLPCPISSVMSFLPALSIKWGEGSMQMTVIPSDCDSTAVVSAEEMTLIRRISDVVRSGHGPEFVV